MKISKEEILEELANAGIDHSKLPIDFFTFDKTSYPGKKNNDEKQIDLRLYEPMHMPVYGYSGRKINTSFKPISKMVMKDKIINT